MSFYEENTFSMAAGPDTRFLELNTIDTEYGELLKSAFVFGANGSGKTNFIKAMGCMKDIVLAELKSQSTMIKKLNSFAYNENSRNMPSVFEVELIVGGIVYEYGFEVLNGEVCSEYLYKKTKRKTPIFLRTSPDFKDINLSKDMDNVKELTKNTRRDTLFLYWANGGNNEIAMTVYRWFESIQIFDANDTNSLLSATTGYIMENGKGSILNLLQKADTNILDFDIEMLKGEERKGTRWETEVYLTMKRNLYNSEWEMKGIVGTSVELESAGTRKLFEIAGPIIKALENGNVVFIDEIDARLHPMLVRFLVMMFNSINNNPNNAQLICNTHDVLLLEEDIRRDQIYFTEKDEYGVSKLYALTDFKGVRKESKLLKQYLLGMFGATPKLRDYFLTKGGQA